MKIKPAKRNYGGKPRGYLCRLPPDLLLRAGTKTVVDGIGDLNLVVESLLEAWVCGDVAVPIVASRRRQGGRAIGKQNLLKGNRSGV